MVNIFTIIICEIDQGKELPWNLKFYLKYTIFCLFYFLTPQHTKLPTYFYNLQCDTKNVSPFFFLIRVTWSQQSSNNEDSPNSQLLRDTKPNTTA